VQLDVGAADPPTLPELPAVGSISSRHGMGRARSRSNPVVEELASEAGQEEAGSGAKREYGGALASPLNILPR
jgi:hypothetical protein